MTSIATLTWNVHGCRDSLKRCQLFEFLKINHQSDFYFLQETHTISSDEAAWQLVWRAPVFFSHESTHSAGVAILINPNKVFKVIGVDNVVPGKLLHIHADIDGSPVHLVNICSN
jgi:exonuclease III